MIDYQGMQLALRSRALTLSVATTGSTTLASTTTGFTRASGSFLTDGFATGMEVTATGFDATTNAARVITGVTALTLTCNGTLTALTASAGRTISVGLPSRRAWENQEFDPEPGYPWVQEQFIAGPTRQPTIGPKGTWVVEPQYSLTVHTPENTGIGAPNGYADALLGHFAPATQITLSNGDSLRVRGDTGPFRGQMLRVRPGFATIPVAFPLRLYTINTAN